MPLLNLLDRKLLERRRLISNFLKILFLVLIVIALLSQFLQTDSGLSLFDWSPPISALEKTPISAAAVLGNVSDSTYFKTILLWTTYFGDPSWKFIFNAAGVQEGSWLESSDNSSQKCLLTTKRGRLSEADAVIFHGRDISFKDLPERRRQKFVFYLLESPVNSHLEGSWSRVNKIGFNWIMSYVRNADVFYPYGEFLQNGKHDKDKIDEQIDKFIESFANRTTDAVWIVSNCNAGSKRQEIVKILKANGISVDIKGACSSDRPDDEWRTEEGVESFFRRYRFYLSFENSLCDDYATEKLYLGYNASQHFGLIPIVYGGANYSALLPSNSYIDVQRFASVSELAKFLKYLISQSNNKTERSNLRRYFKWQHDFHISNRRLFRHENGWKTLCQRLWQVDDNAKDGNTLIDDIKSRLGPCHQIPRNLLAK